MKKIEVWKDIVGYEGIYQVSSFGRVRSLDKTTCTGKLIKGRQKVCFVLPSGYVGVRLSKNGHTLNYRVHRLVASAFLENQNNCPLVMHLDDDPLNNIVENLRWGTNKDNSVDMANKDRSSKFPAKLTKDMVLQLRRESSGISYKVLGIKYGITKSEVCRILNRKTWKHI